MSNKQTGLVRANQITNAQPDSPIGKISEAMKAGKLVRQQERGAIRNTVIDGLLYAHMATGRKAPQEQDFNATVDILTSHVQERAKGLTSQEVELAMRWGAMGRYGEVYGITANAAAAWIESYKADNDRKTVLSARKAIESAQVTADSAELLIEKRGGITKRGRLSKEKLLEIWEDQKRYYAKTGTCLLAHILRPHLHEIGKKSLEDQMSDLEWQYAAIKRARKMRAEKKEQARNRRAHRDVANCLDDENDEKFKELCCTAAICNMFDQELAEAKSKK